MAVVVIGAYTEADWGITNEEAGFLATTSVQVVERVQNAVGKNSKGEVVAVAYYNKTSEVTIEGLGDNRKNAGAQLALNVNVDNGNVYVDESTITYNNEDWVKTSIKGVAYENIT